MNWQDAVERTVAGLGYDLVDAEKSAGGLLRVFIDHLPATNLSTAVTTERATDGAAVGAAADDQFITVDDCEKVTRQLQHVLEVDNVAYERLEVSSPGLDRPLKKAADYARFVGEQIEMNLKLPFKGRKKYRGELAIHGDGWRLLLAEAKAVKGSFKGRTKAAVAAPVDAPVADMALDFSLDEVRDAHLVPVVDFKGRRSASPAEPGVPAVAPVSSAHSNDEVDGGRIQ